MYLDKNYKCTSVGNYKCTWVWNYKCTWVWNFKSTWVCNYKCIWVWNCKCTWVWSFIPGYETTYLGTKRLTWVWNFIGICVPKRDSGLRPPFLLRFENRSHQTDMDVWNVGQDILEIATPSSFSSRNWLPKCKFYDHYLCSCQVKCTLL
jgi:hypothetical protein